MTRRTESGGFTVIELSITMAIALSVMTSILGILVSQSKAERRVSDFADNQEVMRQTIVAIQRDIRSAEPLEEIPGPDSAAYALRIDLNVYDSISAPPTPIRWRVDTTTSELVRELLDGPKGDPIAVTYRLPRVANYFALDNTLFEFYSTTGGIVPYNLSNTNPSDVANCTVRVRINLRAAPKFGSTPILLTSDAQLRNRLPGGIGCTNL